MHVEKVKVELKVSPTFWDEPPRAKIYFNNDVLFTGLLTEEKTLTWEGNLVEGEQTVKIVYRDKNPLTQIVLEDGEIIKDQLLNIDAISIDEIVCDKLLHSLSTFVSEDGTEHKEIINLGTNGTWTFKFSSPVYIWLLEHLG